MIKERYTIITFETTVQAMQAESAMKNDGQDGRLIPVPSCISAGCGLCWGSTAESVDYFKEYLSENDLKYEAVQEAFF